MKKNQKILVVNKSHKHKKIKVYLSVRNVYLSKYF